MTKVTGWTVFAHANCTDGFASAWAAHQMLEISRGYQDVRYRFIPAGGQRRPRDADVYGRHVLCLDTAFSAEAHAWVGQVAASFLTIDHHQSTRRTLGAQANNLKLDERRSGAALTWDTLRLEDEPRPLILDYVEDADLYRWVLPHSREVSAWLRLQPDTFAAWDKLFAGLTPDWFLSAAEQGAFYRKQIEADIAQALKRAMHVCIDRTTVPVLASAVHTSEFGEILLKRFPQCSYVIVWTMRTDGDVQLSLRSRAGEEDVDRLASRLWGGGGHPAAAGATVAASAWFEILRTASKEAYSG